MLLCLATGAYAQTPVVNLKLEKTISNASPALGDVITYTVAVTNTGSATATSVVVSESMTAGLSTYLSSTAGVGSFTFNVNTFTGSWTIGSINPGQTVTLLITARVDGEGVSFNSAEVASMDGTDVNSTPGNGSLVEDDYDNACFSVPLTWYTGDEYIVDKPAGFTAVTWLINGNPISATTTEASVDASGNLTIKAPGIYSFTGKLNGCDVSNCCNILVNPGVTASLGDYVFEDKNANGIQDTGDTAIPGVTVTLFLNGTAVATTTTNSAGLYSFTGLTPGTSNSYTVGFTAPAGYTTTTPLSGTDSAKNSDAGADLLTGRSLSVTLIAGENNLTIDAGYYKPASLGDYVFNDKNRDGIQNAGDTPIQGVLVTLYQNGSAVGTTLTDINGLYSFTGLTPGTSNTYSVGFGKPSGFESTSANIGFDGLDSDANPITGLTTGLTLSSGESNTSVDAGFYQPTAGLGDYVFEDKNANGIQDAGDVPIPGVLVTLYSSGSAIGTTSTDANGLYSFTGLTPGTPYVVGFGQPAGFVPTAANTGSNDAIDSDAGVGGLTGVYSLTANEFNPTVDAGFFRPASLGDYVFNDTNRDGVQNAGDSPIPGVVVTLYQNGSAVATTTTNANGLYSFTGLTPGSSNSYSVGFTAPAGYSATNPLSGTNTALDSDANPLTGLTQSVTLSSGESNTTIDAGFFQPTAGLGDYVFEDKNANGIQDAGDVPIPGVLVTLYSSGSAIGTTSTDANGLYSFTGLTPGTPYVVGFGQPAGFVPTAANTGSNDAIDSDAGVGGLTGVYSLTANEFNPTVDAGFFRPASLGDYVFNDTNRDGVQNAGDSPIPGVVVTLYQNGSAVATTTTNANGLYSFTGLTPGSSNSYSVGFTAPAGYSATNPLSGTNTALDSDANPLTGLTQSVTLSSGESNTTIDAGFFQPTAGLGDYVFEDKNANGIQDAGDVPIPGVLVTLYLNGSAVAATTTTVSGGYSFTGLASGSQNVYQVGFAAPAGFITTGANVGSNDAINSDVSMVTGRTGTYTLVAGDFNPTVDAGFFRPASIGDYVFNDKDKDGVQSPGDTPIPGVVVVLYQNGTPVATTTTDATGNYSFTGLTPGTSNTYSVGFTTPTGFTATNPLSGTNTALDSDINPVTGRSQNLTLSSGESNTTIDGGFIQQTAGLGDYVFEDKNANGIQDAGDVPIPGVLVTLYTNSSAIATATTDANGLYSFTGLTPGTPYVVGFGQPAGYVPTAANTGSNDAIDSDAGVGGLTGVYSLTANEFNPTVDAGFFRPASLGDYVFNDTNRDGIQNAGDTPIPGVIVTLYQNGSAVATTTTNGSGLYSFTGLTPGSSNSYSV
ncbi:SdrD B-like domain-containing protein, partial [uncultured Fibrella sp.]|uniref:SdrD B-like domain-containing protein n=1 Tax=uncultured Fibrella sp. TaxID=1284596 RepID=UPI0035CC065D